MSLNKKLTRDWSLIVSLIRRERIFSLAALLLAAGFLSSLSGCSPDDHLAKIARGDPLDHQLELSRDDYRHMAKPREGQPEPKVEFETHAPPVPDIAPILAAPRPPKIAENQLVSITVTDDVPLKDVLMELAKLADVDVELDAGIEGGISFIAKNKPFNEVISRISDLAGLRYSMKGGVLRIERDIPYVKTYSLDFLNVDRSMSSTVNVSTNVLSGGGGDGGGGINTGSTSSVTAKMDSDFWKSLEDGIKEILSYNPPRRVSAISGLLDSGDIIDAITAAQPSPAPTPGGDSIAGLTPAERRARSAAMAPVPTPAASSTSSSSTENSFYIVNRQAGVLTVSASENQHELIRRFLDKLESNASSQVLIEAKILEVDLNDLYKSGIDWTQMRSNLGIRFNQSQITSTDNDVVSFIFDDNPLDGTNKGVNQLVRLTEQFGTVRTLSSPRLHAINNQTATLTFAQNEVYFELKIDRQTSSATTTVTDTTVESTPRTVPIGIILSIQPSINLETNEVTLSVRPTLSALKGQVTDPAVAYLAQTAGINLTSSVPIVEVRELDSILKLKSGQVMVIGGLMRQESTNTDSGIPGLSGMPVVGNLFKGVTRDSTNAELIIFIKATIVGSAGNSHPADRTIYNKFSDDPRPLTF